VAKYPPLRFRRRNSSKTSKAKADLEEIALEALVAAGMVAVPVEAAAAAEAAEVDAAAGAVPKPCATTDGYALTPPAEISNLRRKFPEFQAE
jgi:hypothetical protein